jgi:uncharacterized protein (TIGR02594 family)
MFQNVRPAAVYPPDAREVFNMRAHEKTARTKQRTKTAVRKASGKRPTAARTVKRARKPRAVKSRLAINIPSAAAAAAAVAAPPAAKNHSLYNGLILALGIVALSMLAGSVFYFNAFDKAGAVPHSPQIAIDKLIDEQVAAGRMNDDALPLIANVPAQQKVVSRPVAIEPAAPANPTPSNAAVNEAPRSEPIQPRAGKQRIRRGNRHSAIIAPPAKTGSATFASTNGLIAEARRYLGTNPTGRATLWCGAFLDMVLRKTGHRGGGNLALGYARYGTRVSGPQVGAIVVLTRKGGGHVGIVTGIDANGNPIVISGNHNRRVAEAVYPRSRVVAYVEPDGGS